MSCWWLWLTAVFFFCHLPAGAQGDCWLIEGEKGYVWLAICSQNQPPYETIPQHINSTVHDLRLNENKLKIIGYSSLSRFGNLTDLNLTKNEIYYIEEGAFLGQSNLQILYLGYNKLTNLSEGMLRGLPRLQFLFVQHNLIEVVTPNAFSECLSLISIDLSSNRITKLDSSTFSGLQALMVCELAGNPFHCGCELYGFLDWLAMFNNVTRNFDRLQCETPREFAGFPLLSPRPHHSRNAITVLQAHCRNGGHLSLPRERPTPLNPDSFHDTDESSGFSPGDILPSEPTAPSTTDFSVNPTIDIHHVTGNSATLIVTIPYPYQKLYVLVQYNNSFVYDVTTLKHKKEYITLDKLKAHVNYTFCVTSIRFSKRYNHTCLFLATRGRDKEEFAPNTSTTTHYIMTILGCLFGMVIILGVVYYCLRKKRMQEEKKKSLNVKKTILEMRYGSDIDPCIGAHSSQKLTEHPIPISCISSLSTSVGGLGSGSEKGIPPKTVNSQIGTPKVPKGTNYMEVRSGDGLDRNQRRMSAGEEDEDDFRELDNGDGSASEISTIAKEVDKVNQIINNCIDALKLDTASFLGGGDPELGYDCQSIPASSSGHLERLSFLSPTYKDGVHPLQRQLSADAATVTKKRCSISSSGSIKSARVFSLDVPDQSLKCDSKYIEKSSPLNSPLDRHPLVSSSGVQHLDVKSSFHCSEHRHSFPALYYEESADTLSQRVSFLKPLSRSKRDSSYSQLSPRHHFSGYSSSPEYSTENTHKIWERFRPYKKHTREEVYIAAGHALRKKVQFAKGEDLHDILDYWKGVSAQQKL